MLRLVPVVSLLLLGCGPGSGAIAPQRTLPDTISFAELPPDTTREAIAPQDDWVIPVDDVEVAPGDVRSGVLLSDARAARVARLRISHDELRALYLIDTRTWGRERGVYERYLLLSDEEISVWQARAQRTWWETEGDEVSLFFGLALGIVLSVSVGAVIAEIAP